MKIKLENKRLLTCAEMLKDAGSGGRRAAADIGADHGYLACLLVQDAICERAVAADINEQPLKSAARTVEEYGLGGKVSLVLSDGLDSVPREGITDIICAGMGGELIARIIFSCEWAKECTLILQPMTKADELRRRLYESGFAVEEERACRDGKFVYAIMRARYASGEIPYPCDDRYIAVGRIKPDSPESEDYIRITAERLIRAGEGMLKSADKREEGERAVSLGEKLLTEIGGQK